MTIPFQINSRSSNSMFSSTKPSKPLVHLSATLLLSILGTLTTVSAGVDFTMADKLKPVIEKAGFTNVHHELAKIPVGPWAANRKQKDMGAYVMMSADTGFEAFGIQLFTTVLGMELEDARHVIQMSLKQARNRHIHGYGKQ